MKPTEWAMLVLLSIFWGGSFFFVEIALRGFQPFALVFLRVTMAALILLIVVYIRGQHIRASPKTWGEYFVMGALNNTIPFCLIVWGQTRIDSGVASSGATNVLLVTFLIPVSALLLGIGVLGEVIHAFEYAGMGGIFMGLIVIDGRVLRWITGGSN